MSEEIRNITFEEPVLLSQPARIGEFVRRYFYHAISGFGTVQTRCDNLITIKGVIPDSYVRLTWHDFGRFEDYKASWSIGDGEPDELKRLNDGLCDDEAAETDIKEMIYGQLDDDTFDCFKDVKVTRNGEPIDFSDLLNLGNS